MPIQMKRPSKTVELCTDMSLAAEHERLEAQLRDAEREETVDPRLAKRSGAKTLASKVQKLEQAMADSTLAFTLTALSHKRWTELAAEHPPREDNEIDDAWDVNISTFIDAAMPESITAVTEKKSGNPVEFTGSEWDGLADQMTDAQWNEFGLTLLRLNRQQVAPDFSKAASRVIRNSASK